MDSLFDKPISYAPLDKKLFSNVQSMTKKEKTKRIIAKSVHSSLIPDITGTFNNIVRDISSAIITEVRSNGRYEHK